MDYKLIVLEAIAAASNVSPERGVGCCRVYVVPNKEHKRGLRKAFDAHTNVSIRYLTKAYGTSDGVLYIGYDNCDGCSLARATAIVNVLQSHGISAYRDEVGD